MSDDTAKVLEQMRKETARIQEKAASDAAKREEQLQQLILRTTTKDRRGK